jgi:peroxiredoxin Q/BCP
LDVGDTALDFQVPTTAGGDFSLEEESACGRVVLAFYPKSFTSGCTHEMEVLRFLHPRFAGAGVSILGVSVDSVQTQQRFKKTLGLPFELLADDQSAAKALDCLRDSGKAERDVYVIGPGRKIEFAIHKLDPRNEGQYRQLLDAVGADTEGL